MSVIRYWIVLLVAAASVALAGCGQRDAEAPGGREGDPVNRNTSAEPTMVQGKIEDGCGSGAACSAPRNDLSVPDVVGLTVREAQSALARHSYGCAIATDKDADARATRVVRQYPKAGRRGEEYQTVYLAVTGPLPEGGSGLSECEDARGEFQFRSASSAG